MDFAMISFTGSNETGRQFLLYAADSNLKKLVLRGIQTRLNDWKTGDPLNPANDLWTLVDNKHCAKVKFHLREGDLSSGVIEGPYLSPTVYEDTPNKPAHEKKFLALFCQSSRQTVTKAP